MEKYSSNILFIHPTFFFQEKYHKDLFYQDFPLKTLQLSSLLKKIGKVQTDFLDFRFEKRISKYFSKPKIDELNFKKDLIKLLEQESIQDLDNIGIFLTSSFQFLQTKMLSDIIKESFPTTNIIVGGHYPMVEPKDFLKKSPNFDVLILGEPESTIIEIFKSSFLRKSKYKKKPQIISSKNIFDLNNSPFPDYKAYMKKYNDQRSLNFTISASKGCPFNCRFCKIPKTQFRNYTFPNFMERFEKLQKIALNYTSEFPKISFLDQSFNSALLSNKILNYIIDNSLQEQIKFSCQTRIEIISHHSSLMNLLKKAKMCVGYGFETANKKLLFEMNKTKNPTAYIKKMRNILSFYKKISKPYCRVNIIAGFPGENKETFQETIAFLEKNAFHPNIQINPTLYINDPITYVYKHMNYYRKKYGSSFIKDWWKIPFDPLKSAVPLKASKTYPRCHLLKDYLKNYRRLLVGFKFTPLSSLINWKKYFGRWTMTLAEKAQ